MVKNCARKGFMTLGSNGKNILGLKKEKKLAHPGLRYPCTVYLDIYVWVHMERLLVLTDGIFNYVNNN
jgi:hypothetical protein